MRTLTIISLLFVFAISCKKEATVDGINFTQYVIKKHKSTYSVNKIKDHSIEGMAMFTPSCEYVLTNNIGQINKLVGLSNGTKHHENSVRIGWTFENNRFNLYAYWYYNSERKESFITSVQTNEVFNYSVTITGQSYIININGQNIVIDAVNEVKATYLLYPYFGGEEPWPNETPCTINLKIIE